MRPWEYPFDWPATSIALLSAGLGLVAVFVGAALAILTGQITQRLQVDIAHKRELLRNLIGAMFEPEEFDRLVNEVQLYYSDGDTIHFYALLVTAGEQEPQDPELMRLLRHQIISRLAEDVGVKVLLRGDRLAIARGLRSSYPEEEYIQNATAHLV